MGDEVLEEPEGGVGAGRHGEDLSGFRGGGRRVAGLEGGRGHARAEVDPYLTAAVPDLSGVPEKGRAGPGTSRPTRIPAA
ncbi:hypothetical protein GCM10010329_53770 [Streptomyces spiroverticillatus]|uniref:Uncharacterized protein n=1 Tax=Streptomyces finlayi TaxID=67296 RepID=A0A918X2B0_9ACTN|nr:hypothetical protein GCM10010329_53770 [Streptomyces spiroverticillatus]GHD04862.1 hypothetical protein GCM10010334_54690 [Streptomyces finlayi]